MANCIYTGNERAVKQVDRLTPANVEIGDTFTATINNKNVTYTAAAATVDDVVDGLLALLQACTFPEFAEITWEAGPADAYILATAKIAGVPFTLTATATNGGAANTQTHTRAAEVACEGPGFWDHAKNWEGNAVPANGDDVIIDGAKTDTNLLYNLSQAAVTLASLTIRNSSKTVAGLPERNSLGYDEYRTTYLTIGATLIDIDSQAGRIKINVGTAQTSVTVRSTGASSDSTIGLPALLLRGTHASNALTVQAGSVGVALLAGETSTIATLRQSGGTVKTGVGVTLTDIDKLAGTLIIETGTTTLINDAGDVTLHGGAHADITANGGTINYNSAATLTAYVGNNASVLTFDGKNVARDVDACTLNDDASVTDTNTTVTWTTEIIVTGPIGNRVNCGRVYLVKPQ